VESVSAFSVLVIYVALYAERTSLEPVGWGNLGEADLPSIEYYLI
jgi:hypothetical protein